MIAVIKDDKRARKICNSFPQLSDADRYELETMHVPQYFFFKRIKKNSKIYECFCTCCRTTSFLEKPKIEDDITFKHNTYGFCPYCKNRVIVRAMGYGGGKIWNKRYAAVMSAKDDALYVSFYELFQSYWNCHSLIPSFKVTEFGRLYLARGEMQKYSRRYLYMDNGEYYGKYCLTPVKNDNPTNIGMDAVLGLDEIDKTFLRYFDVMHFYNQYNTTDLFRYMVAASKHPNIEYIAKQGLYNLIYDLINGSMNVIRWKSNNLKTMLSLNKGEIHMIDWKARSLRFYGEFKNKNPGQVALIKEIIDAFPQREYMLDYYVRVSRLIPWLSIVKIDNYAQRKANRINDWIDYLEDVVNPESGCDINDSSVIFPKDLQAAHEDVIKRITITHSAMIDSKIESRAEKLKKYAFDDGNYTVIPPHSAAEIISEGKILSHCVGRYVEKHATGKTTILFVRKADEPETPFYTMEISLPEKRIVQCRGYKNNSAGNPKPPEMKNFEREYIRHIKRIERKEVKTA